MDFVPVTIVDTFLAVCDVHGGVCQFIIYEDEDGRQFVMHLRWDEDN